MAEVLEQAGDVWVALGRALKEDKAGIPLDSTELGARLVTAVFATGRPILEAEALVELMLLAEARGLLTAHEGWAQVADHLAGTAPDALKEGNPAPWLAAIAARGLQHGRAEAMAWGIALAIRLPLTVEQLQQLHDRLWLIGLLGPDETPDFLTRLLTPMPEMEIEAIHQWHRLLALLGLMHQRPLPYTEALVENIGLPALLTAAAANRTALALDLENILFHYWLSRDEREEHYTRWIGRWAPALAALGRRDSRTPAPPRPGAQGRPQIAILVHVASQLSHVQAMMTMLTACTALPTRRFDYEVHFLFGRDEALFERLHGLGVPVVAHELTPGLVMSNVWAAVARRLAQSAPAALVWLCLPAGLAYAFGRRLAPVQIWWSLKFHPPAAPDADLRIGGFAGAPPRLVYEGWDWANYPASVDPLLPPPDPAARAVRRASFGDALLLGTLAREAKMADPSFLDAVIAILRALPQACWLYTGRAPQPALKERFARAGLQERIHDLGWVDTALWTGTLDLHLDTFPQAGGLIAAQCAAQAVPSVFRTHPPGTPVSGVLDNVLYRECHSPDLSKAERDARRALLTTPTGENAAPALGSVEAYVAWACRLGRDAALRQAVGQAQQAYTARYLTDHATPARAFEAALAEALDKKAKLIAATS